MKATKTPCFVEAVGRSPQVEHAFGLLSWARLEKLLTRILWGLREKISDSEDNLYNLISDELLE